MSKVIFSVQYEINPQKRDEYLGSIVELKSLISAEGLDSYSVFEVKGRPNCFEEIFVFSSRESYDNYDDSENERISILISKIEDFKIHNTTRYHTLFEIG